jgi:hypothetical protein
MEILELAFWAFLFVAMGMLIGKFVIPKRFRVFYAVISSLYGLLLIWFLDVNLNFPIRTTTIANGELAPYWLTLMDISGKFLMIGAFLSCRKSSSKTQI